MDLLKAHGRLSAEQRAVLWNLEVARGEEEAAEAALEARKARVARLVYDAMAQRVPASLLAERLGVSTSRIYQMRDEVRQHIPQ